MTADETTTGLVFDVQKFAIHDGPGIRTTVFLKGCPLRCLWCHNPESQAREREVSLLPSKCIGCGQCASVCPRGCHVWDGQGMRVYQRDLCTRCGACTEGCYARALEPIGYERTVAEVLAEVEQDRAFYASSGGGMTVSGGEPLAQAAFTLALLTEATRRGLHTCVETSGYGTWAQLAPLVPVTNLFLFDYKESDPTRHQACTGVPREPIVANLERLNAAGAAIVLRCPIVPGFNDRDDHFTGIATTANTLRQVQQIELLPYHPLGQAKHERLGRPAPDLPGTFPAQEAITGWQQAVASRTQLPVIVG